MFDIIEKQFYWIIANKDNSINEMVNKISSIIKRIDKKEVRPNVSSFDDYNKYVIYENIIWYVRYNNSERYKWFDNIINSIVDIIEYNEKIKILKKYKILTNGKFKY